ncbi:MAG: DUF6796 family protein [Chloroflexota bacterium]
MTLSATTKNIRLENTPQAVIIVTGLLGILAAILIGISDAILFGQPINGADLFFGEAQEYELMVGKSPAMLMWGSLGGVLIPMLIIGYWHWYVGMVNVGRRWARLTMIALSIGLMGSMVFHFTVGMMGSIYQTQLLMPDDTSAELISSLILTQYQFFIFPALFVALAGLIPASILFFIPTIRGKTLFPRWYAFTVPIIAWPLCLMLATFIPAPLGGYIGTTFHWSTIVFFAISTIVLIKHQRDGDVVIEKRNQKNSQPREKSASPSQRDNFIQTSQNLSKTLQTSTLALPSHPQQG